jgi:NAD(P)-dependent dehydrogenase (short-subunit alcohol dehydrogenase family)
MSAAVDSVYAMLDGLDVLVNNSGIEMRTINPRFMTEPQPFCDAGSMSAAVDSVYAMLDGLDVLVNNSGIEMRTINPRFMTEPQPFWEVPPAGFRDVLPRVGRRIGSCNALSECGTQHSTRSLGPGRNVSVTRSQCE